MARVFLSSTYEDLREYRDAAYRTLQGLGHDLVGIENFSASDERPRETSLREIAASDLFVGIVAWRYGYVPPEDNSEDLSVSEIEYRHAVRLVKPRLIFVLNESAKWPKQFIDPDEAGRLRAFRERVLRDRVVGFFTSVEDFVSQLATAVARWDHDRIAHSGIDVGLEQLPLAWRLVVDFRAQHDLLRHLEPSAFVAAVEKWEEENGADHNLPWTARLERARRELDGRQSDHEPSQLWLAWMRATRPLTAPGEVPATEDPSGLPGASESASADMGRDQA